MTYLEAVNKVLIRLREDQVSTVGQNAYSTLIGEFVNDALRMVEDAWDWSALRTTVTVTTSADIFNYVLTGTRNRGEVLDVINDTGNNFLTYKDQHWFNRTFLTSAPAEGSPNFYTFNGVDVNGDTAVDLYPIPNQAYTIYFNMILRTPELTSDTDEIIVPWQPIVHYAVALANRERGETGGTSTPELFLSAERMLSDAIQLDSHKHPEEMVFRAV